MSQSLCLCLGCVTLYGCAVLNTNKWTYHSLQELAWKDPNWSKSFPFNLALHLTPSPLAIYLSLHPSLICLPLSLSDKWNGVGLDTLSGTSMGQLRTDWHPLVAAFISFSSDSFSHKNIHCLSYCSHSTMKVIKPKKYSFNISVCRVYSSLNVQQLLK